MEAKKTSSHEQLVGSNPLIIRQSRFESEGDFHVTIGVFQCKLINYSVFGLGIISEHLFTVGQIVENVAIVYNGQTIAENSFVVKRCKKADFGYEVGLEATNNIVPIELLKRLKDFDVTISVLNEKFQKYSVLPDELRLAVSDLVHRLDAYEQYSKEFANREFSKGRDYNEARDSFVKIVSRQIHADLNSAFEKLKGSSIKIDKSVLATAFSYFREHLGKYIFQSPFTKRSYEKPLGYAGDFEMMNQIYANDNFANTIFGNCMEAAVQMFGEPGAVRNRVQYFHEKIMNRIRRNPGREFKILSLASGPAEEIKLLVSSLTQSELDLIKFELLDQDEAALQYAQKNIFEAALKTNKKVNIRMINVGIKEVMASGLGDVQYDLIYSAGLFDYFTDPVASRVCKKFSQYLTEKGSLIIGNFNVTTTNWTGMMAMFDWNLILRDEKDLIRLFGIENKRIEIDSEGNNINLFCCINNG